MTQFLDLTRLTKEEVVVSGDMTIHTKGGVVHREDGPAIYTSWSQEWYVGGIAHREDGPAKLYLKHPSPRGEEAIASGGKNIAEWYKDGKHYDGGVLDDATFQSHWHKDSK